jgi:hypothetical protein
MKLLLVLALAGCGTTVTAHMINPPPQPMRPRPPETVQLFTSGPPLRPYVDVAYLEADQQSEMSFDDTSEFLTKLRERAGAMGCDAVVIGSPKNKAVGSILSDSGRANVNGLTATCIVYIAEDEGLAKK